MGLTAYEHVQTEQSTFDSPEEDAIDVVPFGIYHLDANFIMGIKPTSPQLNVLQGGSGSRKTTLMFNFIVNMCLSGKLPQGHKIIYDIQENGFSVERCGLVLRSMLASKYIIYRHHSGYRDIEVGEDVLAYLWCLFSKEIQSTADPAFLIHSITSTYNGHEVHECVFTPDFIEAWYRGKVRMSPLQTKAWTVAGDALERFPIEFFGVSEHSNFEIADKRSTITTNIEDSYERWCRISEECGSIQVITDYIQEYWLQTSSDHYQKQLVITPWLSRFIKEKRQTIWAISQEGIQHQRDFQSKGVVLGSSGGDVLKSASQNNWRVSYNKETSPYFMTLHSPVKSRRGNHPDLQLMIEPSSGVIFGRSRIAER